MQTSKRVAPFERQAALRRIIADSGFARVIEAHSGLSAIVGENANVVVDGRTREYDAIWESSLTDSATKGIPDASIIGVESRLHTIDEIIQVTTKPLIVDGDTGGEIPQFEYLVTHLERMGVSAVIIEDKVFPKRNSLDASASQELEDPETFAQKISLGKEAVLSDSFMIIARLESLIAGAGLNDAIKRAETYIRAGVDGIMIHSGRREPNDLFDFARTYDDLCNSIGRRPPLVCVPTTYNHHLEDELVALGFNIIIHANHLLRACYRAMTEAAQLILKSGSSLTADEVISPVKEIFSAVGFDRITAADRARNSNLTHPVIIPAAGRDPNFPDQPKSLISIGDRRILDHQLESIRKSGLKKVVVVRGLQGWEGVGFSDDQNLEFCENPLEDQTHVLHSLMQAEPHMDQGFTVAFADILFDPEILGRLISTEKDIVLGIDASYTYHKHNVDKKLDLVISRRGFNQNYRSLRLEQLTEIVSIGKNLELKQADFEFIGLAHFSEVGARVLREVYHESVQQAAAPFHESQSFQLAGFTDMIQELIKRGYPIYGLEVRKGWREIHTKEDVRSAERELDPSSDDGMPESAFQEQSVS